MIRVKNLLLILNLLFFGVIFQIKAQDAVSILDKAAQTYEQSNGVKANFALHSVVPEQNISESYEGIIEMSNDKFKLTTPDMITWYNGETQWVYVMRSEEVNVTTPSGDELQFTNPAILLKQYKKGFKAVYKGITTTQEAKSAYEIELIPKIKKDIKQIDIQIDKISNLPASIRITDKKNAIATIHISQWETGLNHSDSFFVFNESDYPDAEVVDLR